MSVVSPGQTAGLLITVGQDTRVTRSGAFIRKTKLDELVYAGIHVCPYDRQANEHA